MLKGLSITPPILGRISIGKVVERNGKRLPEKDDQFTITSQVQNPSGWLPHPLDEGFRQEQGGKLRSIPIRLLFNDPDLNFRADYSLFDRTTGRPLCVGNGETAKGMTTEDYMRAAHVVPMPYSISQRGVIDSVLASMRINRDECVAVQSFTAAPYLLQGTDLVFTTTRHFAPRPPLRSLSVRRMSGDWSAIEPA